MISISHRTSDTTQTPTALGSPPQARPFPGCKHASPRGPTGVPLDSWCGHCSEAGPTGLPAALSHPRRPPLRTGATHVEGTGCSDQTLRRPSRLLSFPPATHRVLSQSQAPSCPRPQPGLPPALSFQTCRAPGGFTRSAQSLLIPPRLRLKPGAPTTASTPSPTPDLPWPQPRGPPHHSPCRLSHSRPLGCGCRSSSSTPSSYLPISARDQLPAPAAGTVPHTWGGLARVLAVSLSVCCPWRGQGPRSSSDASARPAHRRCSGNGSGGHAHE